MRLACYRLTVWRVAVAGSSRVSLSARLNASCTWRIIRQRLIRFGCQVPACAPGKGNTGPTMRHEDEEQVWALLEKGLGIKEGDDSDTILHRLKHRGPELVVELRAQVEQGRMQAERDEKLRQEREVAARTTRQSLYEALRKVEEVAENSHVLGSKELEEAAAASSRLAAIQEEKQYLLSVRRVMMLAEQASTADARGAVDVLEALVAARSDEFPQLDQYACATGLRLATHARSTVVAAAQGSLEACGWPKTLGAEFAVLSEEAEQALMALLRLQSAVAKLGDSDAGDALGHGLWAADPLSKPVLERFAFHFEVPDKVGELTEGGGGGEGQQTIPRKVVTKTDWALAFLLRTLRLSHPALTEEGFSERVRNSGPAQLAFLTSPLMAFFARDMTLAARRKLRSVLPTAWSSDGGVSELVEQALKFDGALDELGVYAVEADATGAPRRTNVSWPRAAEVLCAPDDRLERWVQVDHNKVTAKLQEACEAEGAWEASRRQVAGGMAMLNVGPMPPSPTPAAQSFMSLINFLTNRYRPLRSLKALGWLVNKVMTPLCIQFLNCVYTAAKDCGLMTSAQRPDFEDIMRKYCHVINSTCLAYEAVDDALNDVAFIRLDERSSAGVMGEDALLSMRPHKPVAQKVVDAALKKAGEGLDKAIRRASATTESFTRAVEESNSIIGPVRMVKSTLGALGQVVKQKAGQLGNSQELLSPGPSATPRDAVGTSGSGSRSAQRDDVAGAARSGTPRPGHEVDVTVGDGSDSEVDGATAEESRALEEARQRLASLDGAEGRQGSSGLGYAKFHLSNFRDSLIEDVVKAITAAFMYKARHYIVTLPPPPNPLQGPSPSLLPALTYLDAALNVCHQNLERESMLIIWQSTVRTLDSFMLKEIRACRACSEQRGTQLALDIDALTLVLTRPPALQPDNYLLALRETARLISMSGHSLDSLYEFLDSMMVDVSSSEGVDERGETAAAMQLRQALEVKGIVSLTPEEVLAVLMQRKAAVRGSSHRL